MIFFKGEGEQIQDLVWLNLFMRFLHLTMTIPTMDCTYKDKKMLLL